MTPSFHWVELGWVEIFKIQLCWIGLGQPGDGLGWIGSHKMNPWTALVSLLAVTYMAP